MSLVWFQVSKIWMFFGKFMVELILKSFSGRNNSLEVPIFGFYNSLPYNLKKSLEFRAFLVEFCVIRHSKMQKIFATNFVCVLELPLWIYQSI